MALLKAKYSEIPSDAVVLTEEEALEYQYKTIYRWKKTSDIFALKYGGIILSSACALSGLYINQYFRQKYRLGNYGPIATVIPAAMVPALTSFFFHAQFVTNDILLQKYDCPVCVELRASAIQGMLSCIFPTVLVQVGVMSLAHRYFTIDIPYITKEPQKLLEFVYKKFKPLTNTLFVMFVGQALLASAVTYFEHENAVTVNNKMQELHQMIEDYH